MQRKLLLSLLLAAPIGAQTPAAYLIDSNLDQLFSVDINTGAATLIGGIGVANTLAGLTWRPDTQTLWAVDLAAGGVGTLNTTTGAWTQVFATGLTGWQGIDYDISDIIRGVERQLDRKLNQNAIALKAYADFEELRNGIQSTLYEMGVETRNVAAQYPAEFSLLQGELLRFLADDPRAVVEGEYVIPR